MFSVMKILNVFLLLVSISTGLVVKIGGLFDTTAYNSRQIFRYAAQVANNERLTDSNIKLDPRPFQITYGNEFAASNDLCKLLKIGVSAVFGPSAPSSSTHCMNICDAKEVPYIDVKWDAHTKPPVINMHPHPDAIAQVFVDLIKAWEWKGFTIVYESAPWLKRVAELLKLYDPKEYTVTVRRIDASLDKTNFRPVLRRVKLSKDTNIVLDCSIETLPELLKQAQQVGLMTDYHKFIITTMDMHTIDLEPYQYSGTNITGIRLIDPENPLMEHVKNFMAESDRDVVEGESETALTPETISVQSALIFDGVLLLAEAFKQLSLEQLRPKQLNCNNNEAWESGSSITNFMRNTMVQGLTGDIKFDNQGYRTNFAVDVIELTSSGIEKVGTWNSTDGLNITRKHDESTYIDDGSLRNKTVIVITSLTPPYGMLKDSLKRLYGNDRFEGYGIDLIHELSLMLGFNYVFRLQEDGKYGSYNNATRQWDGMIRELIDERADLAITDLTVTAERESGVDFTMPFMNLGISILLQTPTEEPPSTFAFMSPFSTEVWIYLGGAYLSVSFCLFFLGRISPSEWDNPFPCIEEPTELENQFSLRNSLWFTIGALLQQGSDIAPKGPATRAVATIWWFFTLIMVSSYTANLAAFLTIETLTPLIRSAEDLKECGNPEFKCPVEFGAKRDGSTINFFKEAKHGTYKSMYQYMQNNPHLLTKDNVDGLEWAKTKKYAFLMESSSIEYLVERNCKVMQIGGLLDDKEVMAMTMRRSNRNHLGIHCCKIFLYTTQMSVISVISVEYMNSTYRSALSEAVLRLQEQGKLTSLKIKWWKEKGGGKCSKNSGGGDAEELKMANMKGVFYVLSAGSLFASLYGICEWLFLVFLRAKRRNLPLKNELKDELKFVIRCGGNTKAVRHRKSTSMDSRQSNASDGSHTSNDR